MFLSGKEMIFFVLTFAVIFFFSNGALYMGPRMKTVKTLSLFIMSLFGALSLMLVYKFAKIPTCQADNFRFEVTGPKLCEGGPYMWSSAPQEIQDYCNNLVSTPEGRSAYDQVNCGVGFHGRPVHWQRSTMSNDDWENEMCDHKEVNMSDPCVM